MYTMPTTPTSQAAPTNNINNNNNSHNYNNRYIYIYIYIIHTTPMSQAAPAPTRRATMPWLPTNSNEANNNHIHGCTNLPEAIPTRTQ